MREEILGVGGNDIIIANLLDDLVDGLTAHISRSLCFKVRPFGISHLFHYRRSGILSSRASDIVGLARVTSSP
jgi:hypothetical protein